MRSIIFTIMFLFSVCFTLRAGVEEPGPDYLNPELTIETRVNDLVARLTLEEKVAQMMDTAPAVPRLQIPAYNWWNECLHGVARAGVATVFPQAIGLGATWDTDLMAEIADVISTEARAKHHEALRRGDTHRYKGLTFWSPNVNIFRDPRWGRGQETYGEDPYLIARMGVMFVQGLQGDNPDYFKVIATPKHYAVHSGPEPERHTFEAVAGKRDLYETYLPAFAACVKEARAYSVMCAYNRYQGQACCGSPYLLNEILRDKWGFTGYIVSDCRAITDIFTNHQLVKTAPEAAALAVKAGTDLNCGRVYHPALVEAVQQGLITEAEIDVSVKRLFTARFKLGMFDPPERVPYAGIPIEENDSEEHRRLSIRAAQESIVLLKNKDNLLPLNKDLKKIAVIGPLADSYEMLLGNYNGKPSRYVTPLQGIRNRVFKQMAVVYKQGCNLIRKGSIIHTMSPDRFHVDGQSGLKAEYFKNKDLKGEPFLTRTGPINHSNWAWGRRVPGLTRGMEFSIRWTGTLTVPETGDYDLIVRGDDGYRLSINNRVLIEDWTDHVLTTKSQPIHLEKGTPYDFKLEYFQSSGWSHVSVEWRLNNKDSVQSAVDLAEEADAVIFVGGITAQLEGEEMPIDYDGFRGGDRTHLRLPQVQMDLLQALQKTVTPIVLVLCSGSALAVNWANENLPAIVQIWYPGQEGGTALADVLFGDYNPGARLPVTFYKSVDQLPPFADYNMQGRTYRYFKGEPLFPFGYGLSYTTFTYDDVNVPDEVSAGESVSISVRVQNTGKLAGDEVVQLYVKDVEASVPVPLWSLQGMKRIHLDPGQVQGVSFVLKPRQMAVFYDTNESFVVEPGTFQIAVGGALPGTQLSTTDVIVKELCVTGNQYIVE